MSKTETQASASPNERRIGMVVAAIFVLAVLYVVSAYARFHQTEHGEIRYEAGRNDLCGEIKSKRPDLHRQLAADKLC